MMMMMMMMMDDDDDDDDDDDGLLAGWLSDGTHKKDFRVQLRPAFDIL